MKEYGLSRRAAFRAMAAFMAGSPLARTQQDPFRDHSRVPALNELNDAFDFEPVAYAKVPRFNYDNMAYGTDSEFTLRRNRQAFDWVDLVPKRILGAGPIQTATEILGTKMAFPIFVSPSATHNLLHPDAEIGTFRGAMAASDTPYMVSNVTSTPFEKIAAAGKGPLWAQMYPKETLDENREWLERIQAAGAKAIVVTIDQQAPLHERALHDRPLTGTVPGGRRPAPKNPYRMPEYRLFYSWKLFKEIR